MKIYEEILREEMVKALGCTEPIAVALCGAKAREVLGKMPTKITIKCSNNIVKNVKGVDIPTTKNMKGIDTACVLGCIAGDASLGLEVLRNVKDKDLELLKELLNKKICKVEKLESGDNLHIICMVENGKDTAEVEILHSHSNIVLIKKNNETILDTKRDNIQNNKLDTIALKFNDIYDFVNEFTVDSLKDLFELEIECNNNIAEEGLKNNYGANVGKTILKNGNGNIKEICKAYAAAGSDARMAGCSLPVVINSGSGNQGMTILSTVYQYWKHLNLPKEKLYRALCFANLVALWIKQQIGKLSAFCGAVSAGTAAGAAITYMRNGTKQQIENTIINALNGADGIICDGAKSSCALKIAVSVENGIIASDMAMGENVLKNNEGLVKDTLEKTVSAVCRMARVGMKETDEEILRIMLDK
ncbi:MAG: serine dehydratase subunit alpha family protein [Rickettsiales bacterium]|nr:serine dehydratase subunit alpha family protein [Rickettsiales bacterium]